MENISAEKFSLETDLKNYPTNLIQLNSSEQITIGDLHANAMLMIHFLVINQILVFNVDDYLSLVKIYYCAPDYFYTKQDFNSFAKLLDKASVNSEVGLVRFLGDMLADRGKNDYFILLILECLTKNNISYEILFSNHDADFILYYENGIRPFIYQSNSLNKLLLKETDVQINEVKNKYRSYYKKKLKLLSYSYTTDQFVLFSHAPICLKTIKELAKKFKVSFPKRIESPAELARIADIINKKFCNGTVEKYYHDELPVEVRTIYTSSTKELPIDYPVTRTVWNRVIDADANISSSFDFKLTFVHGHHHDQSKKEIAKGYLGLDTLLGKTDAYTKGELLLVKSPHVIPIEEKIIESTASHEKFKQAFDAKIQLIQNHGERLIRMSVDKGEALVELAGTFRNHANQYYASEKSLENKNFLFKQCHEAYQNKKNLLNSHRFSRTAENIITWLAGTLSLWLYYAGKAIYHKKTTGKFSIFNCETRSSALVNNIFKLERNICKEKNSFSTEQSSNRPSQ